MYISMKYFVHAMKTQLPNFLSLLFPEQNTSVLFTYAWQNPVASRSQLLFLTACCCITFYRLRSIHAALQWPPQSSPTPLARTRWRRRHGACSGCLRANNRCSSVARVPNTWCGPICRRRLRFFSCSSTCVGRMTFTHENFHVSFGLSSITSFGALVNARALNM